VTRIRQSGETVVGQWWHVDAPSDRIVCDLCPRECHLKDGDRGFCFVRENRGGQMVLSTYGKSTGFCIDPIEKKPLNHFFPGTSVLSFGTAGCNLGCKFCQNWEISKSREVEKLSHNAMPDAIAAAAHDLKCKSVAYTYNDPVVWAEYAIDTAKACRERGIKNVAVTAGYILPEARREFYSWMDAANVDLKGFTEDFYWKVTNSHLQPVLETLKYLRDETNVWFEVTNLVIPQCNDDRDDLKRMSEWIVENLGPNIPVHFSAFHPDFRMQDRPNTPIETLIAAYELAKNAGIRYPFVGNVHDPVRQSSYCHQCGSELIERDWYQLGRYSVRSNRCVDCGTPVAGHFEDVPGDWGRKRQPIDMRGWTSRSSGFESVQAKTVSRSNSFIKAKAMTTALPVSEADSRQPAGLEIGSLTEQQRENLVQVCTELIACFASNINPRSDWFAPLRELQNQAVFGVFVTLKRGKHLRGCCGSIGSLRPLAEQLWNACRRTALEDMRFPPISPYEVPFLNVDISLLEQLEPIVAEGEERLKAFEIGRHGLVIQRGDRSGLLLPSVSVDQGWNAEQFLRGVCRKAGLPEVAWSSPDVKLQRFAGLSIHGSFTEATTSKFAKPRSAMMSRAELTRLQELVVFNLGALSTGATPTYFFPEAPDGTVSGLVLSIFTEISKRPILHVIRLAARGGLPLQSTLFEMTEMAVRALNQARDQIDSRVELSLTVLNDPAAHGSMVLDQSISGSLAFRERVLEEIGLEGLPGSQRAIVAMTGPTEVVISFAPETAPAFQIYEAAKLIGFRGSLLNIYSMEMVSTRPTILASNLPIPQNDPSDRQPAVDGLYYPNSDQERRGMVSTIFNQLGERTPSPSSNELLAIMTPHAGLAYSGRIAARAWQEVQFPRRLLIIGPKHTRHGVDWAIAPCRRWNLSDSTAFESDHDLTKKLVERVDGLQLDSMAHHEEHGIEVQLPFLEYLYPNATLSGIVIHQANWSRIETAAKQLASVLQDEVDRPLLVISSDMNHYAPDEENRRRDRLALDAIVAKDPRKLLTVCQENQVSMCGLIPAMLVMQTLTELGIDYSVDELGYATSGEVASKDRVVGYAALAFRQAS
jgi:AmmeMemoRadiSam system radical SAM enzyme/AmmeMemoRadiSam system protein B/AmmeMemoRadiSam system protein A